LATKYQAAPLKRGGFFRMFSGNQP